MGADRRRVPDATVARLPVYLRILGDLADRDAVSVSSEELAEQAGVNAAKVRKDLSYLGTYGTRGVGYDVDQLTIEMRAVLGLTEEWGIVIVGAGNLGQALAGYQGFEARGYRVVGVVDVDPQRIGRELGGCTVAPLDDLAQIVADHGVAIGVIATPPTAAAEVADRLVAAGITSILNFAPIELNVPAGVSVRKVDLAVELQILSYHEQRRRSRLDPGRGAGVTPATSESRSATA